jgi:hypothetical protein
VKLAVYAHENFIQVPDPVRIEPVLHTPAADYLREERPEPFPPETHCLVRDVYAALVKQIVHIPKRQRKAGIHHRGQADAFGRDLEIPERVTNRGTLRFQAILPELRLA